MKLCLIRVWNDELFDPRLQAPLGLAYLAAALETAEHEVTICDLAETPPADWAVKLPADADCYGISATTGEYVTARTTMRCCRKINPKAIQIIGGAHASCLPEECVRDGWDVAFMGESELSIVEFARGKKSAEIDGICYKTEHGPQRTHSRELIEDLDTIRFPARHLCEYETIVDNQLVGEDAPGTVLTGSRGCVMGCAFCATQGVWGRTFRIRSPENIAAEIRQVAADFGVQEVRFVDDQFGYSDKQVQIICEAVSSVGLAWRTHMRVEHTKPNRLAMMAEAGCVEVALGCEAICQPILDHNNKRITVKQIAEAVENIRIAGMRSKAYIIIGLPGESPYTIEQTKQGLLRIHPDRTNLSTFVPYPGCPIWNDPDRYDYTIEDQDWAHFWLLGGTEKGMPFVGRTFAMSRDDLFEARTALEQWLYDEGFTKWKDKFRQPDVEGCP